MLFTILILATHFTNGGVSVATAGTFPNEAKCLETAKEVVRMGTISKFEREIIIVKATCIPK